VDKPPEVEELEVEEEEDSTFPEDCYTESETSTNDYVYYIEFLLLTQWFVCVPRLHQAMSYLGA